MSGDISDLPHNLRLRLLSFIRETDGGDFEVTDNKGFVEFIFEHRTQFPALGELLKINESAVLDHFKRTGNVPPGIKMVQKTQESKKVTRLEVHYGPKPK